MPEKFDLGEYVQVKDRLVALYELFGQARIETLYELTTEPDDKPKVICRALVYRTPDDAHPSTGTSWMYLPGTTPYTKGSEIENAETSAVGRAIGMMGILIDKSIATSNEIAGKEQNPRVGAADYEPPTPPTFQPGPDGGMIGVAEVGKAPADFELRESPDGWSIAFRLASGRKSFKVIAEDELALMLSEKRPDILDKTVTAWGRVSEETFTPEGTRKKIPYTVLYLSKITVGTITLPAIDRHDGGLAGEAAPPPPGEAPQIPASPSLGLDA